MAIDISIEDQWLAGEPNPDSPSYNHSQMILTDSLGVEIQRELSHPEDSRVNSAPNCHERFGYE